MWKGEISRSRKLYILYYLLFINEYYYFVSTINTMLSSPSYVIMLSNSSRSHPPNL